MPETENHSGGEFARLLATLNEPDDLIEIRIRTPSGVWDNRTMRVGEVIDPKVVERLHERNNAGDSIYFTPARFNPELVGDISPRRDGDVQDHRSLFVDFDGNSPGRTSQVVLELIRDAGIPSPSAMVETSPNNFHVYWMLAEAIDPDTWRSKQRGLIAALDSDSSICNPSRVMRAPEFVNRKEGREPFRSRLVGEFRPDHRLDVDEFDDAGPTEVDRLVAERVAERVRVIRETTGRAPSRSVHPLNRRFLDGAITQPGERTAALFRCARDMAGRGWDLEEAMASLVEAARDCGMIEEYGEPKIRAHVVNAFKPKTDGTMPTPMLAPEEIEQLGIDAEVIEREVRQEHPDAAFVERIEFILAGGSSRMAVVGTDEEAKAAESIGIPAFVVTLDRIRDVQWWRVKDLAVVIFAPNHRDGREYERRIVEYLAEEFSMKAVVGMVERTPLINRGSAENVDTYIRRVGVAEARSNLLELIDRLAGHAALDTGMELIGDIVRKRIPAEEKPLQLPEWYPFRSAFTGGGFRRGEVVVIAGIGGSGKTVIGCDFVRLVAENNPGKVGAIFNYEMSHGDVGRRLMAPVLRRPYSEIERLQIDGGPGLAQISVDAERYRGRVYVDSSPGGHDAVEKKIEQYRPDIVLVDQFQHLAALFGRENSVANDDAAIHWMRMVAMTYRCVVVTCSQINKLHRDANNGAAVKGSTSIEHGASVVIVYDEKESGAPPQPGEAVPEVQRKVFRIAKNRNGVPGRLVELEFNGARMEVGPTKEARLMNGVYPSGWDGHGGYQR